MNVLKIRSIRHGRGSLRLIGPILLGCCLAAVPMAHGQALHYTFNDGAGTTVANSGSAGASGNLTMLNAAGTTATDFLSGSSAGGISGADGTQTLNLTSATGMGGSSTVNNTGPYAASATAGGVFEHALSFTIAGWYNASTAPTLAARLLETGGTAVVLSFGGSGVLDLQVGTTAADFAASTSIYNATNAWTFFAVTYSYNSTTNQVTDTFYSGSTSGSLVSSTSTYTPGSTSDSTLTSEAGLSLGSSATTTSGANARPFQGSMDNISVYSSSTDASGALDSSAVNSLFLQEVPEPASLVLTGLGLFALIAVIRLRRDPSGVRPA